MAAGANLAPLAISVPIAVACLLLAADTRLPRRVVDAVAIATGGAVAILDAVLLSHAVEHSVVTWSGGWLPHGATGVGIVLVADPVGVGAALLAALLTVLALVFSWHYLESARAHFHALMLLFLAGMSGFALSGDLFNMFVFFELMGAVGYALTGYQIEEPASVQGALSFGLINSLGAYLSLFGIGLLYAHTGQLGLAQLRVALSGQGPSVLVQVGFVLVVTGFLGKAAIVPFHLWLDDAHAVAPTPVCVLFSGVMVELGLYGALRVYTVGFSATLSRFEVHRALLVLSVLSTVIGAVMCFAQRHVKRLLAYSTIAHLGLFGTAVATLDSTGTSAALLYAAAHAGVKSALFMLAGVTLNRFGSVDELDLHGRGRNTRASGWLMVVGGFALAGLPPFGSALGKAAAESALSHSGASWAPVLFTGVSALTGAAVLRAALRIFFGWGPVPGTASAEDETTGEERAEVDELLPRVPLTMFTPIVLLLGSALALGTVPGVGAAFGAAAARFTDPADYQARALATTSGPVPAPALEGPPAWTSSGVILGLLSVLLAGGLALAALYRHRLPAVVHTVGRRAVPALRLLRTVHSGHVGDYVTWLFVGVGALCAVLGLPHVDG